MLDTADQKGIKAERWSEEKRSDHEIRTGRREPGLEVDTEKNVIEDGGLAGSRRKTQDDRGLKQVGDMTRTT